MPIEHHDGGVVITGDSINFIQLAALRGAVSLELKGLKMSRGRAVWKMCREFYKIPGSGTKQATKEQVFDWLCAKVEELRPLQEHISIEDGRVIREVGGKEVQ